MAGSQVALSLAGELLATAFSDNNGNATLAIDSALAISPYKLVITATNYKPFVIDIASQPFPSTVSENKTQARTFELKQCYPNPFNPIASIEFSITKSGPVTLSVFNTLGQKIKTICDENLEAGQYKKIWDSKNDVGAVVANGLYFFQLKSLEGTRMKSCLFLK